MALDFQKGLTREELQTPVQQFLQPVDTILFIDETVGEGLSALRQKEIRNVANYFYGVDREGRLEGIVSARNLLFAEPEEPLHQIMSRKVIKIRETTTLQEALNQLAAHQLLALPVVDEKNVLLGIVQVPAQEISIVPPEEQELPSKISQDIFQMIGITLEQARVESSVAEYRYRMPWLLCNIVGGLLCAAIAGIFEQTLDRVVILALFIPLVLSLCESIAMQSMTLSLQLMHQKKIALSQVIRRVLTETKTGVLLGMSSVLLVSCVYLVFNSNNIPPLAPIGVSIFASMIISALLGTLIPIGFHALHWDPKVAAGPIVLTLSDVVGTTMYLSLATIWLMPK